MADTEREIVEKLVDGLEADEATAAQPGMESMHGGPGTSPGLNYSPGATPGGGAYGQHEGAETRPLAGDYVAPTGGAEGADTIQAREDAYRAAVAQKKIDHAATVASLRAFGRDPVVSTGYVPGIELLVKRIK